MLPSELLAVRIRRGNIEPAFVNLTEENVEAAKNLIGIYADSLGKKYGELEAFVEELEQGMDFKFVRGLRTLLERRCVFETKSSVDPIAARRLVFGKASKTLVTTREKRAEVMSKCAAALGISVEELEGSLFADYEEEQVLREFDAPDPKELLKWYNLALAQTLLFKAVSMEIFASGNYQGIFRGIKRLGLMYLAEKGERIRITVEGPASLFKMTERYGTSMAKLLPEIIGEKWRVKATIVRRAFDGSPRTYVLELDDRLNGILPQRSREQGFDSAVEEKFYDSFSALSTGWSIAREPDVLLAGSHVFIPDFVFTKGNMKIYMEVVGFWTEDYLRRKMEKLRNVKESMIVAVDEGLACAGLADLDVIYFKKDIPLKGVSDRLRALEEKKALREARYLEKVELVGDVISIDALAREHRVSYEAMDKYLSKSETSGYSVVGKEVLSSAKIEKIKQKLDLFQGANYQQVSKLLQDEGVTSVGSLLDFLGYEVKWRSLDPNTAEIVRKK